MLLNKDVIKIIIKKLPLIDKYSFLYFVGNKMFSDNDDIYDFDMYDICDEFNKKNIEFIKFLDKNHKKNHIHSDNHPNKIPLYPMINPKYTNIYKDFFK